MSFISKIKDIGNYKTPLICVSAALLFLGLAIYIYFKYLKPSLNPSFVPNKEYVNKDNTNGDSGGGDGGGDGGGGSGGGGGNIKSSTLYFFYAEWCPYSKKALKTINNYKTNNPIIENVKINYKLIKDETNDTEITNFEKEYGKKIEGYPTIYLIYNNQVIEFDATINKDNLDTFFNSVL
jgi:thiol-disulfide isomerase/thioredoxin